MSALAACVAGLMALAATPPTPPPPAAPAAEAAAPEAPVLLPERTLTFGRFGTVTVYRQTERPAHVVLFVSGDGGWNLGVVDMARQLATQDSLVAGVDITHYLASLRKDSTACSYPAGDFEELSKFVQQTLEYSSYVIPILVGYSSGATLVYATLAQSPENTFAGALSLGFCPDLPLAKPMCKGSGLKSTAGPRGKGYSFLPSATLPAPWIALQGEVDRVCAPADVERFAHEAHPAEVIPLPKVGHGFSVTKNWMPEFATAFDRLVSADAAKEAGAPPAAAPTTPTGSARPAGAAPEAGEPQTAAGKNPSVPDDPGDLSALPIVEVRAKQSGGDTLAVILTGDGGWAGFDKSVSAALADQKIDVVGLNSLQYYWKPRTPDGAAHDLERIARHYLAAWGRTRLLLIGYSFGADVLPFLTARLPDDLRGKVRLVTLVSPSMKGSFAFHFGEWLGRVDPKSLPILPEMERLAGLSVLCLAGKNEDESLCKAVQPPAVVSEILPGGHHLGGDYEAVAALILKHAGI
jgi:type IV secretory pathway VirJ component